MIHGDRVKIQCDLEKVPVSRVRLISLAHDTIAAAQRGECANEDD